MREKWGKIKVEVIGGQKSGQIDSKHRRLDTVRSEQLLEAFPAEQGKHLETKTSLNAVMVVLFHLLLVFDENWDKILNVNSHI